MPLKPIAFPHSFALKLFAFLFLQNSLCLLIHPQTLLVHSPSELFKFGHAMGFRVSDEGMHSLAIKSTRVRFP